MAEPAPGTKVDPAVLGTRFEPYELSYEESDTILYALGVGAGRGADELDYVWEERLVALPTQPVVAVSRIFIEMTAVLGVSGKARVHGEQRLVLHRPPPTRGRVRVEARVTGVWDKGAGAVVDVAAELSVDGEPLATATFASFVRGGGGWGGERGQGLQVPDPEGPPDVVVEDEMAWNQALLYRLTGDLNPLHVDPVFAAESGFDEPIAHGLCTYGFAVRMAMKGLGGVRPERIAEANCRFVTPVYPGQKLRLELWNPVENRARARLHAGDTVAIDPLELVLRP
jgi:acyl dehydratase